MADRGNPPKQYVSTMSEVFEYVKKQWSECGRTIAGERGYAAVHLQSVRKSHPAFPIFMVALAGCVVCCNGARLRMWGSLAPIVLWVINCNYTQTRKSGLAGIVEVFAEVADKRVRKAFRHIHRLKQAIATNPAKVEPAVRTVQEDEQAVCSVPPMQEDVPAAVSPPSVPLSLWSIAYLGGTIDRCKERCAGDFNFCQSVKPFKDLPPVTESNLSASLREVAARSGLSGRTWFSSLLLFDEIYDFLMDLGVTGLQGIKFVEPDFVSDHECGCQLTCASLAVAFACSYAQVDLLLARCPWGWLTLVSQPLFLQDVDTLQFQLGPSAGALGGPIGASLDPPLSLFSTMQVSLPSAPLTQEAFPGHSHNQAILITPNGLVYVEAPVFADAATFRRIVSTRASTSATGGIMRLILFVRGAGWRLGRPRYVGLSPPEPAAEPGSDGSAAVTFATWLQHILASWLQVGDFGDGRNSIVELSSSVLAAAQGAAASTDIQILKGEGVLSFEVPRAAVVDSALLLRQVLPGKHIFIEIPDSGVLPHATFAAVSPGQDCIIYRLTDASDPTATGLFLAFSGVFDSFSAFLESLLSSGRPAAGLLRSLRTFGLSVLTWECTTIPTRDDCHFWYVHIQADFARARGHAVQFFGHPRAIRQPSVLPPPRVRAFTHVGVQTNAPFITASTQAAVLQSPPTSCGAGVVPDSASELVSLWCDSWHIKCIVACIPGFTVWALREGGRLVGMCTPVPTWEDVTRALSLSLWELPQTFLSDNNQVWPYPRDLADVTRKCVSVGYDSPEGVSQLLRHCTAPYPSPPPSPPSYPSAALGLACLSKGKLLLGFLLFAMQAGAVQLAIAPAALTSRVGADDPLLPGETLRGPAPFPGHMNSGVKLMALRLRPLNSVQIHLWLPGQGPVHMRVGARHMDMHLSAYLGAFLPDCEYGLHVAYDSNPQVLDLVVAPPSPVAWWILRDSIGCELLRPVIQHYTSHCSFFFCTVEPDGVVLSVEPSAEVRHMSPSPHGARALISRALPGLIGQVIEGTLQIVAAKAGPSVIGCLAALLLTYHAAAMQPPQAHQLVPVVEVAPTPSTIRIWTLNVPQPVDLPWRPQGYQTRWLRELMCRLHHIPDPGEFRSTHSQQGGTVQHVLFVPVVPPTLPTARFWLLHWGAAAVVTFGHSPFRLFPLTSALCFKVANCRSGALHLPMLASFMLRVPFCRISPRVLLYRFWWEPLSGYLGMMIPGTRSLLLSKVLTFVTSPAVVLRLSRPLFWMDTATGWLLGLCKLFWLIKVCKQTFPEMAPALIMPPPPGCTTFLKSSRSIPLGSGPASQSLMPSRPEILHLS
ncbi:unnamed protein product [Symbiodinium sp. CCMP2592]|nr:unnamed protein product [Symbiodinium sp. CCMP2592]